MTTFEDWYQIYPRKKARGDAVKAWAQMLKLGHSPDDIMAGLKRNLADLQRRDPQFIPYPATWLRAESFFDEPDPIQRNQRRTIVDAARSFIERRESDYGSSFRFPSLGRH